MVLYGMKEEGGWVAGWLGGCGWGSVGAPSKMSHNSCSHAARRGSVVSNTGRDRKALSQPEERRAVTKARRSYGREERGGGVI